ncbi:nitroreductase family protein, partial [Desulfococcaceae bacterium OttesenSCG-928-F15]|nr:nitroreductase family protein [Desulfococcaceae bacterium OttesenSCG-928-F15]
MDTLQALEIRKSVREYQAKAVEAEKLESILKAANNAPKAGAFQVSVVLNPDLLKEINDKALLCMKKSGNAFLMERAAQPGYEPMYGAPVLLVFSAPPENPYSLANVSNAATSGIIAATALGLGSCYIITPTLALNEEPALCAKIGIPQGFRPMCCMLAGYAGGDKFASPKEV